MQRKTIKTIVIIAVVIALSAFLAWRFLRPMNIFVVSAAFERPIPVKALPAGLDRQSAKTCGRCHTEIYNEWATAMHSRAWTDPYFQADWKFDGAQQICKNCHTPLQDQQEYLVMGFRDKEKWDPILEPNPKFDASLQHEGVTCDVCHLRDGKILGPYARTSAPHAVAKMGNSNQVCIRCHVVQGDRWDTFFRFPPCGTVAEIEAGRGRWPSRSGEVTVKNPASLGCVECHMPAVTRPLVPGGPARATRAHLWRGGHDPEMVRQGLDVQFTRRTGPGGKGATFVLRLENTGAGHYLPTGTPDRYLSVALRLLGENGKVLKEEQGVLRRMVMWRPFIVDLRDTRLAPHEPRTFTLAYSASRYPGASAVEAVVQYHLVDEARRRRINYRNPEPIEFEIYRMRLPLDSAKAGP
jgi:hypothetical protein